MNSLGVLISLLPALGFASSACLVLLQRRFAIFEAFLSGSVTCCQCVAPLLSFSEDLFSLCIACRKASFSFLVAGIAARFALLASWTFFYASRPRCSAVTSALPHCSHAFLGNNSGRGLFASCEVGFASICRLFGTEAFTVDTFRR